MTHLYDLIIFDCDGTLVNSEELNCKASVLILEEYGIFDYSVRTFVEKFMGLTLAEIFRRVEEETGVALPGNARDAYIAKVKELQKTELESVESALSVVEALSGQYKMCVGSNGERSNVLASLSLSGFDPFFTEDNIFTKIQVERPKPAPDLFLYAAQQMGSIAPSRCLVIEDSVPGVTAGVAAGMDVFGFTGVAHDPEKSACALRQAGAKAVFNRFIHIEEVLTS